MNQKVIIAVAAGVLFAAGTWLVVEQRSSSVVPDMDSFRLPRIEGVHQIRVSCQDSSVSLELQQGSWRVVAPFEDDANEAFVSRIAEVFSDVRGVDLTRPATEEMVERAGDSAVELDVVGTSGEFHGVVAAAAGGGTIIRELSWIVPEGSRTAFRVGTDLFARLDCDPEAYRDPMLVSWNASDVREVRLRLSPAAGAPNATLRRTADGWSLQEPSDVDIRVDATRVDQFVGMLTRLRAARLAAGVSLADAGITDTSPTVVLSGGDAEVALQIGQAVPDPSLADAAPSDPRRQYYVRVNQQQEVWQLPSAAAERLTESVVQLRSLSVSSVNNDQVAAVQVEERAQGQVSSVLTLEATDCALGEDCPIGAWRLRSEADTELDTAVTGAFLNAALRLRAASWLDGVGDEVNAAFDATARVVTLVMRDGDALVFEFVEASLAPGEEPVRLGRTSAGEVFVVPAVTWELLGRTAEVFRRD